MKLLVLPSWYPTELKPLKGVFFKEQTESLHRAGHSVSVLFVHQYRLKDGLRLKKFLFGLQIKNDNGVPTFTFHVPLIPFSPRLNARLRQVIGVWLFEKFLLRSDHKPVLLVVHSYRSGNIATCLRKKHGINYVLTEHSSSIFRNKINNIDNAIIFESYANASSLISVSGSLQKLIKEKYGFSSSVVPNFIPNIFFEMESQKKENGIFRFLSIGFLKELKNLEMLIEAFASAFPNGDDATLTIVGEGDERNKLEAAISRNELEGKVFLPGALSREEVLRELKSSNAFVLSSKYETFGVVVVEALAAGLPVVSTRCGGPESIIENDSLGILCDIDAASLADALKTCRRKSFDRIRINEFARSRYSENAVVANLNAIYESSL